jgi:hypothetical protein
MASIFLGGMLLVSLTLTAGQAAADHLKCPSDAVEAGTLCIDRYEASVWNLSGLSNAVKAQLVKKIHQGTVTGADLLGAGATQLGLASGDLVAAGCPAAGNGCVHVYAVSIPGVMPARFVTWFQAAAIARNSAKRLPTNAEWQAAALGTPDTGGADDGATTCYTDSDDTAAGPIPTGSRAGCVSDVGAFDMVGNVLEWVADWAGRSGGCGGSWEAFSDDFQCLAPVATTGPPGALLRGGSFLDDELAGPFAVVSLSPSNSIHDWGFRAAR